MSDPLVGNVLAVQLECLSPVSNAILRGIITEALNYENVEEVYGSSNGFCGILNRDLIDLALQPQQTIRSLAFTPGSILGTFNNFEHLSEEMDSIFTAFKDYNIRFLLVTGGIEAQSVALQLSQYAQKCCYGVNIISVPDTIYNNLPITDHCLGYGSASKFIATTIRELSYYALAVANHDFINVIEVSAGNSDWLILSALLNVAIPNIVLLSSDGFGREKFLKDVQNILKSNHYCNVIVSNFLVDERGNYVVEPNGDVAVKLKNILEESLEVRTVTTRLGPLTYAAAHFLSKTDVDEAYTCGVKAVRFALDGETEKMVTILRSEGNRYGVEYGVTDLKEICVHKKSLPIHWFDESGKLNANFSKYALPLIQGNIPIEEENGLPKFATLKLK